MNYLRFFVLLYFITHTCFCRIAHWVTVIVGILDTAHYLKGGGGEITCRISFHISSPSLFHLNKEADPVPEGWDYFLAQTMGNV